MKAFTRRDTRLSSFILLFSFFYVKGEGGCKNLNYLDCVKNKTLTGHVIKTVRVLVPGLEVCQQNCFREGKCVSYNLGPVEGQIRTCELNAADHWTRPDFLAFKEGFEYCPIENRCSSNPCPEGRLCTPDFAWDTFNCDDGGWTQWGPWPDACILSTCLQTRKRSCSSPVPQRNGANCAGLGLETRKCKIPKTDISGCQSALGMEDGRITDSQINTSSTKNSYPASAARLNNINTSLRIGAWCADSKELGQYIQVDLGRSTMVTKVATQGRPKLDSHPLIQRYVTKYKLMYSSDNTAWTKYQPGCFKPLPGNVDRDSIVTNSLEVPIKARYIRLIVDGFRGIRPCLRMELYGCEPPTI